MVSQMTGYDEPRVEYLQSDTGMLTWLLPVEVNERFGCLAVWEKGIESKVQSTLAG